MLTKEQIEARVNHKDWPECLEDLSIQWHWFIELGEYDLWHFSTVNSIEKRIKEMDDRFIRTFYPRIPF